MCDIEGRIGTPKEQKYHERYNSGQKADVSAKGLVTGFEHFFLQYIGLLLCKTHTFYSSR